MNSVGELITVLERLLPFMSHQNQQSICLLWKLKREPPCFIDDGYNLLLAMACGNFPDFRVFCKKICD